MRKADKHESAHLPNVVIYTDGACYNNRKGQGLGGAAAILECNGHRKHISRGWRNTTNNRMELWALIIGLSALTRPCSVLVVTDSKYVITVASKTEKYARTNWMKPNKRGNPSAKPIMNADLLRHIDKLKQLHELRFTWVKGHSGHAHNELCDRMADKAAGTATEIDIQHPQEEYLFA